ncbi:MAG: TnsA endonuclease N-terminal domain-containing protein [Gammaproteobacteria bacterium]|nr:TnsA endonuclease N-terminal domain-containing protein [Gammaproteobacteria bacterium]MBU2183895.1 TnsA endonuclease N-terminal domain-containing protein [Gammaproteobacteria bacterium]MBU2203064.1 TnsA endonuclease N-terminal domain-containing protein [Gammaproteobacteria bacterium]
MYIRSLRKPSPNKNVFKFASAKVSETIMCESSLEFDACFHHEYNENIKSFGSQPEGFYYHFGGKKLPYTPDAIIHFIDGTVKFHEYKPYSKTFDPIFRAKFLAKKEAAQSSGVDLILVTERQIRVNPILNNLKILHRYSGIYGLNSIQIELINFIRKAGKICVNDIALRQSLSPGETKSYLYSLIHKGLVKTNLNHDDLACNPAVWCIS